MSPRPALLGIAIVGLALAPAARGADERDAAVAEGRTLFAARGCSGCHAVAGTGGEAGPDLSRVGTRYTEAALRAWLTTPDRQRLTVHTQVTLTLTSPEVRALAAYLGSLR
jgi:cytochrome c553